MNGHFHILLSFLLFMGCNQNTSQTEKDYIKNLEEKNKVLEKELQEVKSKADTINISQGSKQRTKNSKDYFAIGSTEEEVIEVMGDPTGYIDLGSSGKRYQYGGSIVFFEKGKVASYNNLEGNLKARVKK